MYTKTALVGACPCCAYRPLRALILDIFAAGPEALLRRRAVLSRFEDHLRDIHARAKSDDPNIRDVPSTVFRLVVGGSDELIRDHFITDRVDALPSLEEPLCEIYETLISTGAPRSTPSAHHS